MKSVTTAGHNIERKVRRNTRSRNAAEAPCNTHWSQPEADHRSAVVLYTGEHGRAPADLLVISALCGLTCELTERMLAAHHAGCRCPWCRSGEAWGLGGMLAEDLGMLRYITRIARDMITNESRGEVNFNVNHIPDSLRNLADAIEDIDSGNLAIYNAPTPKG